MTILLLKHTTFCCKRHFQKGTISSKLQNNNKTKSRTVKWPKCDHPTFNSTENHRLPEHFPFAHQRINNHGDFNRVLLHPFSVANKDIVAAAPQAYKSKWSHTGLDGLFPIIHQAIGSVDDAQRKLQEWAKTNLSQKPPVALLRPHIVPPRIACRGQLCHWEGCLRQCQCFSPRRTTHTLKLLWSFHRCRGCLIRVTAKPRNQWNETKRRGD